MSQLRDAVAMLASQTPDEIAATIQERGIKGRTGTTYGCPLAIALHDAAGGQFVIGQRYIVRRSGKVIEKMQTPPSLANFVRKFDLGGYPALLAPAPRCIPKAKKRPKDPRPRDRHKEAHPSPRFIKNHIAKLVDRFA